MHSIANDLSTTARPIVSGPQIWLRLEGLAVLLTAGTLYSQTDYSWWLFFALLLTPDLAMIGYLVNPRIGSMLYNVVHSYLFALSFGLVAYLLHWPLATALALIWLAHIGMDRTAGYGLKYADAFKHTHLDRI